MTTIVLAFQFTCIILIAFYFVRFAVKAIIK